MSKGPIAAIFATLIIALLIYLFADIRPPEPDLIDNEVVTNSDVSGLEVLDIFNSTLQSKDSMKLDSLLLAYDTGANSDEKTNAINGVIAFYEEQQQYNFAAYYHNELAEVSGSAEDWELAGDRQLSVSQNDAYNTSFNEFLYSKALEAYNSAYNLDTNNVDVKVKLASALLEDETNTMQGVTMLLDVVRQDSTRVDANLILARFGIISSQFDKAIKRLENILSLQPQNTEALFLLGEAYSGLGNTAAAVEAFSKCRDLIDNEEVKNDIDLLIQNLESETN